jgi:hypothetical protein
MVDPDYLKKMKDLDLETDSRPGKDLQADLEHTMTIPVETREKLIATLDLH